MRQAGVDKMAVQSVAGGSSSTSGTSTNNTGGGAVVETLATPDSPFASFKEVTQMSKFAAALQEATSNPANKEALASLLPSQYSDYLNVADQLTQCYSSVSSVGGPISDTWSQGVSSTTQGVAATQAVDSNVEQMKSLSKEEQLAAKAAIKGYDVWIKTGSPSRKLKKQRGRRRGQVLGGAGEGAMGGLPAPLTGTYDALKGLNTDECRNAYKDMSDLYNNGNLGNNNGGLPGTGSMPGGGQNMGSGGMPSQGSLPGNPFGSSPMSGTEPGTGGSVPPNPFGDSMSGQEPGSGSGTDAGSGSTTNPLDGATNQAGQDGTDTGAGQPAAPTASSPEVADTGTNKCKTFNSGNVGVQLCQGSTTTASSATITGSVINVGQDTLCGLNLIIDSFELSSSYYPTWLPHYTGIFMPGDTITFGVTVPYAAGTARPQVDLDNALTVCPPPSSAPSPAPTMATKAPTTAPTLRPTVTPPPVFDWANVGGRDTKCLKGCVNIIQDLTACEAFDSIFAFRCDVCDKETLGAIRETCQTEFTCGDHLCHSLKTQQSSGASRRAGRATDSVKTSLSLLLGFLTVFLVINMG
jgi:hypothetical protein